MLRACVLVALAAAAAGVHVRSASAAQFGNPSGSQPQTRAVAPAYLEPEWRTRHVHVNRGTRGHAAPDEAAAGAHSGAQGLATGDTSALRSTSSNVVLVWAISALGSVVGAFVASELLRNEDSDVEQQLQGLGKYGNLIVGPWALALGWVFYIGVLRLLEGSDAKEWSCVMLDWYCLATPPLTVFMVFQQLLWLRGENREQIEHTTMGRMMGMTPAPWGIVSHLAQDVGKEFKAAELRYKPLVAQSRLLRHAVMAVQVLATLMGVYLLLQPGATCDSEAWWAAMAFTTASASMLLVALAALVCGLLVSQLLDDILQVKQEWHFALSSLCGEDEEEGEHAPAETKHHGFPVEVVTTTGQ